MHLIVVGFLKEAINVKTLFSRKDKSEKRIKNKYLLQGSRKCGSTGAAVLGNGRPNWGNDAN